MILFRKAEEPVRNILPRLQKRLSKSTPRQAMALLLMQLAIFALLLAILALVLIVNEAERQAGYASLILCLIAVLLIAIRQNLTGRYNLSAWITMIGMAAGPWASLWLDPKILQGDMIPLIYIVISIHLCATFLYEAATAIIALLQLTAVSILITLNPNYANLNWPSLCAYIVSASLIAIVTSYIHHKHIEQIEAQNKTLRANEEQLLYLSTRDSLTGLYNRRYMEETLEREVAQAVEGKRPLTLIMVDIDDFKQINDTYGHVAADRVLSRAAQILVEAVGEMGVVCRYGGDEFLIILSGFTADRFELQRRVIDKLALETFDYQDHSMRPVHMSFGAATFPENGLTASRLLQAADAALYEAKAHKPSRVQAAARAQPTP